jgi:phosphomannomutase
MAKTSPGSARLMIFGEAYDKVFDIATDGNVDNAVKGDCLKLCIEMTLQDDMGSEVFLGNGRLVVRKSGTESIIRFYGESNSVELLDDIMDEIIHSVEYINSLNKQIS